MPSYINMQQEWAFGPNVIYLFNVIDVDKQIAFIYPTTKNKQIKTAWIQS